MKFLLVSLASAALVLLAGCSSLEMPGTAKYYSNQPGGLPIFRVAAGLGGPTLAVQTPDGTWTKSRALKRIGPTDPPLGNTPGLAAMVESAYRVENYVFLEFRPDAKLHDQPVPTRYFLLPGGFAYLVSPPGR